MHIAEIAPLLGLLCVIYTSVELARLATRSRTAKTEFAALDLDSRRPIDVTIDRRVERSRDSVGPAGRRSTGAAGRSPHASPPSSRGERGPQLGFGRVEHCA